MHRHQRLTLAALALVLALAPAPLRAQGFGTKAIVAVAPTVTRHAGGIGFTIGGTVDQGWPVDLRFEVLQTYITPADYEIFGAMANVVYDREISSLPVYGLAGLGVYRYSFAGSRRGETSFGLDIGAGMHFSLAGQHLFAETRLHSLFRKSQGDGRYTSELIPISIGIAF